MRKSGLIRQNASLIFYVQGEDHHGKHKPVFGDGARGKAHAIASGVDAKTLSGILGHTNASFTLDTYTHVTPDMQKAASVIVGGFMEDLLGKGLRPWQRNGKAELAP